MRAYSLSHLSDPELLRGLATLVAQDRTTTAALIAHLAEVDERRLYLPAGYPSMHAYCVQELHLSEDAAYRRITAARAARQFPLVFEAVADGRLHLSAVSQLAPYLTPGNAAELLGAAAHRTKAGIEELIAGRFPRSEALGLVVALPAAPGRGDEQLVPGRVDAGDLAPACQLVPGRVDRPSKVTPIASKRYVLELSIGQSAQDKLKYAQDLLGHELPGGDLAQVVERALDALIEQLERRKFAATTRPRRGGRSSTSPRHIPAQVKRAVWQRDGGQCTFVSETGRRCQERKMLEFDHIEEVARGGQASVGGIRLRCWAHNQYGAECAFGAGFMREKREVAQRAAEARRREAEARAAEEARRRSTGEARARAREAAEEARRRSTDEDRARAREAAEEARRQSTDEARVRAREAAEEVIAPLRSLGFRADEARHAAKLCEAIPNASLEDRVRRALSYFRPPGCATAPATNGAA